jgi:2-polyprenyl-3-methyl-5-hydroxy-6-metoxy-1,4-benzoquinol methylase
MRETLRYEFRPVAACDMCGSTDFRMLGMRLSASQGRNPRQAEGIAVPVKRCRRCGLVFSDPQPVPDDLSAHYGIPPEDYWRPEQFAWTPAYFSGEIDTAKRLLHFTPGMKALDVGVGAGLAMTSLNRAGFDTWGIEPSAPFRDKAVEMMAIDPERIQLAPMEQAEFEPGTFDFITFGAVLEHLYSPSRALERALSWLKPGGLIQLEVPSSNRLMATLINAYFRLRGTNFVTNISPMHPPFHLFEFTLDSFRHNAERLAYEVAEHEYRVCEISRVPRVLHPLFRWWMERTDTGMQLTVYLRKK